MNGSQRHSPNLNKSYWERQILYDLTYMWNPKILKKQQQTKKAKNKQTNKQKKKQQHLNLQRQRTEAGSWEWVKQVKMEGGQMTLTSIYKVNTFWRGDVQHGDNS